MNIIDHNQSLHIPASWQSHDAYKKFQEIARTMSVDQWISALGDACEESKLMPSVNGFKFPGAPNSSVQSEFVGSSGRVAFSEAGRFYKFVLEVLTKEGKAIPQSLMDFGCGWGRYTRLFLRDVNEGGLFGVDPWNYAINLSRQHFPFATFVQSKFLPPLPFDNNTFDVVISYSVFSHLIEHAATSWINEISRVLRPGGLFIGTTHGPWVLDNLIAVQSGSRAPFNKWEEAMSRAWKNVSEVKEIYNSGKFAFIPNVENALPTALYGNSFVPEQYIKEIWGNYMECLDVTSDQRKVSQTAFVFRKV